MLPSVVEHGDV